jgi:hypothetical protein
MNMSTDTHLKYRFGTTPAEVIRAQAAKWFDDYKDGYEPSLYPCALVNPNTTHPDTIDDLIVVLDALTLASEALADEASWYGTRPCATAPAALRIDALAKFGIEEV